MNLRKRVMLIIGLCLLMAAAAAADVAVTFQVDMTVQEALGNFDPVNDSVVLRGDMNGWDGNAETLADDGEGVYSVIYSFLDEQIGVLQGYKFVIVAPDGDVWEGIDNRELTVPDGDTVLDVVFFNNITEVNPLVDVEVMFQVNMEVQVLNGSFDPDVDLVVIRGDHANLGNWAGEVVMDMVTGMENHYSLIVQFDQVPINTGLQYKFAIIVGGTGGTDSWETNDNRSFIPLEDLPDTNENGYGEIIQDEVYFSNVGFDDILQNDVDVVFSVNINPAIWHLDAGPDSTIDGCAGDIVVTPDDINYIAIAGYLNEWPWCGFDDAPNTVYQMTSDDGVIWSVTVPFVTGDDREQIYKYGLNGADNEAGFAENHSLVVDDSEPTFNAPTDLFGSQGTLYDVEPIEKAVPSTIALLQNYPNPFNPSTTIEFGVNALADVELTVYSLLGQEVATIVNEPLVPGNYKVEFNGSQLPSGLYFYTLKAGESTLTNKMVLVK